MICLYKVLVDDLIYAFMQIATYNSWLKGGSNGKGPDLASLKIKVVARYRNPKILTEAMVYFTRAKDLNTRDCALKGLELFGSTKQKLDLPSDVDCDLHQPNKVIT